MNKLKISTDNFTLNVKSPYTLQTKPHGIIQHHTRCNNVACNIFTCIPVQLCCIKKGCFRKMASKVERDDAKYTKCETLEIMLKNYIKKH